MPKTYADLRNAISAYMHRDASAFVENGGDMLLRAVNNAKDFCQRAVDFEKAKVFGEILNASVTSGGSLSNAQLFGGGAAFIVKSVERTFLALPNGAGHFPVPFISRNNYVDRMKRRFRDATSIEGANTAHSLSSGVGLSVMQYGNTLYPLPASQTALGGATVNLFFDAIEWLPDFAATSLTGPATSTVTNQLVASGATFITNGVKVGDLVLNTTDGTSGLVASVQSETVLGLNANLFTSGEAYSVAAVSPTQTNFLLDFAFDYMMFRSIYELNFFLKEDMRVAISKDVLKDTWDNVVRWNASIVGNSVDDANLS